MTATRPTAAARPHVDHGLACIRRGDFLAAIAAFTDAIRLGADSAHVWFQRGAAYYNMNEDKLAEADFTSAIYKDHKPAKFHLFRGLTRLRLDRPKEALIDLTGALERDPEAIEAAWARGRILANQGDWLAAARDFGRVIALKPDESLAYSMRGEMYQQSYEWSRCITDFRRAVELTPDDPKCLNRLAWMLATCAFDDFRDGQHAVELAERANQLSGSNDPLILDTLAAAHANCGNWSQAMAAIDRAIHLAPTIEALNLHRAAFTARRPWRE